MGQPLPIRSVTIHRLAIRMRRTFRHARAERRVAEPIVVAVELSNHEVGYGETAPRPYVSGETNESVEGALRSSFIPRLLELRPTHFAEAVEAISELPCRDEEGRAITAARAAVELALLDAYGRAFGRSPESAAGWFDDPGIGPPGSRDSARFGVAIGTADPEGVSRFIRRTRWGRIRHYKLKVGGAEDDACVRAAVASLGRSLTTGRCTLRLDANGAWDFETAAARLDGWRELPITCVEQPLARDDWDGWARLAVRSPLPLMADESLLTIDDARTLIDCKAADWFNIRISKNGGLLPALQLAQLAREHGLRCQLGCMVGETSLLSAAGRWFLQMVPGITIAEGSYGRLLLEDDICTRSLRFGVGGRWKELTGHGLGVVVDAQRLRNSCIDEPSVIHL